MYALWYGRHGWDGVPRSDMTRTMQTSRIIEVDGVFVGAAITLPQGDGWRFVATDCRADEVDGRVAPTLTDARTLAKRAFVTARARACIGGRQTSR
jgi:hypothetical protein